MIVAAVRNDTDYQEVLQSNVQCMFLMFGNIFSVKEMTEKAKERGMLVFIHIELIKGIANDENGVQYIGEYVKPHGIISTKQKLIEEAKKCGLKTVLHFFVIDSKALNKAKQLTKSIQPDFVEVMPGVIPKIIKELKSSSDIPIIVAGLVQTSEEYETAIRSGAYAVSSSTKTLWGIHDVYR